MKKKLAIGLLVLFLATVFTSCKPRERCPAYGHVQETENTCNQDHMS